MRHGLRLGAALLLAFGTGLVTNSAGALEVVADRTLPHLGHGWGYSNATRAVHDLRHRLPPLAEAIERRDAQLARAAAAGTALVVLEPLPPAAQLLEPPELDGDPEHWINQGFAAYHGVAAVRGPDASTGEYALGHGVWARLAQAGPTGPSLGLRYTLFRRDGPTAFRLRPPPPRRTPEPARVVWTLEPGASLASGRWQVLARAGLPGQGHNDPVLLTLRLLDGSGALLAEAQAELTLADGVHELLLDVPPDAALRSIELAARMPEGFVDNKTGLRVERLALRRTDPR